MEVGSSIPEPREPSTPRRRIEGKRRHLNEHDAAGPAEAGGPAKKSPRRAAFPAAPLLRESFTPHCPVHGLIHLPLICKVVVDTGIFQRMRNIRQLGVCSHVYPGAKHDRFLHSIGTAYLAHKLINALRYRQPELGITERDALCVTLAALCHDLGHPCFSHMFECFIHELGHERRRAAVEHAMSKGRQLFREEEEDILRYEAWTHEAASLRLVECLFEELRMPLEQVGLQANEDGDDFACIKELIDPPKQRLQELMDSGKLRSGWSDVIAGRPVGKSWLYEIVSNWRSGIDVDKFDYFRRDAYFLGIRVEFEHNRYIDNIRVIYDDAAGVWTLSPPMKDKDSIRDMLELRKMLHRTAYQHKATKKLELHMIDVLKLMDLSFHVSGKGGLRMKMSEAAVEFDKVAYMKLTDAFVETRLVDGEQPCLDAASAEYNLRIVRRKLMRLVADWDLPRSTSRNATLSAPIPQDVIAAVHMNYKTRASYYKSDQPVRPVDLCDLRCHVACFHYGMRARDPITRVLFHSTKDGTAKKLLDDADAKPMREKIFFFWNPKEDSDTITVQRLALSFRQWAERFVSSEPNESPVLLAPKPRPERRLKIGSSCPIHDDTALAQALSNPKRLR